MHFKGTNCNTQKHPGSYFGSEGCRFKSCRTRHSVTVAEGSRTWFVVRMVGPAGLV